METMLVHHFLEKIHPMRKTIKNVLDVCILLPIAVLGVLAMWSFGKTMTGFKCILCVDTTNATVEIMDSTSFMRNPSPIINFKNTTRKSVFTCLCCYFMPIISTIAALVCIIYLCRKSSSSGKEDDIKGNQKALLGLFIDILMIIFLQFAHNIGESGYTYLCSYLGSELKMACQEIIFDTKSFSAILFKIDMCYSNYYLICMKSLVILWSIQMVGLIVYLAFCISNVICFRNLQNIEEKSLSIRISKKIL